MQTILTPQQQKLVKRGLLVPPSPTPRLAPRVRPNVAICLPLEESVYTEWFVTWLQMEQYRLLTDPIISTRGSFTWVARNGLAENFLKTDAQYLLFMDSDTCPPIEFNFIERLIAHDRDIIGGWYNIKKSQMPTVYTFDHLDETGMPFWKNPPHAPLDENAPKCRCGKQHAQHIEKVDATGAGCLLIKRSVFERVPQPWFGHFENGGTEDLYMAYKCMNHGIEWWVDWGVHCAHIGVFAV